MDDVIKKCYLHSSNIPFMTKIKLRLFGKKIVEYDCGWKVTFYYDGKILWLVDQRKIIKLEDE